MFAIIILFAIPSILLSIDFIRFLITGKRIFNTTINGIIAFISIVVLPFIFISTFDMMPNDCCTDSAVFSPDHRVTIYLIIVLCISTYYVSRFNKTITSPIIETLINAVLLGGIVFNAFIFVQVGESSGIDGNLLGLIGNAPIMVLFIFQLIENQKKVKEYSADYDYEGLSKIEKLAWNILNSNLFIKIPILCVLCLPILIVVCSFLLLFGQKPDSIIRAFTDTYKHGFSQLDYMCDNVQCGGHFLCSVAANGHKELVSPKRFGERRGNRIMCNRQLLISNAFEELMEVNYPKTHSFIRKNYNQVGNVVHKYYSFFNNKFIADIVYVLMKPLEWFFLFTLYIFDQNPENRIAQQYLSLADRKAIEMDRKLNYNNIN
ncbi:hypothetical protein QSV08_09730 [Maribacter sp. BPC-D8]|uniref:DUF6688 domain-containing protein n=1 Tax=Maribacter sp. BPC-D8 TaxID=3053613 RepID=UPI002B461D46|nr:DUF6688 family protein [Maribacter sp. BPC-D8]WRI31515.1 hypothetical protein QSV08_09730 [Maribacter sp. BPC-D8]